MRIAIRNLVGHPGLALSTLGMLAMALAFVVASLSVLNGLLIRPYPYPRLGQLMLIRDSTPREGAHQGRAIAAADFLDIRRAVAAFSSVAGWRTYPSVITGADRDPERVEGLAVTANFFGMLGVSPLVGQGFAANADVAGQDAVVLLSRRLWSSRFGGDPSIVGRAIGLNGRPVTVLGIIRDEDCYPPGIDAWTPLVFSRSDMTERAAQHVAAIGRLTDTATEHEADAQLTALSRLLSLSYPTTNRGRRFDLLPLRSEQYEFTAPLFLFVQGAALLVLLMAVVNVNNLLVAHTLDRRHELAVRAMLGATAPRVAAIAVREALVISGAAAACGALIAPVVLNAIRVSLPEGIERWIAGWSSLRVDAGSLGAGGAIALLASSAIAVAVATAAVRAARATDGGVRATRRATWGRRGLIAGQVGLAAALLLAGSVMTAGFERLSAAFASLSPSHLLRFTLTLPEARYPDDQRIAAFHHALLEGIGALPDVATAALIRNEPASNVPNPIVTFQREDSPPLQESDLPRTDVEVVSPEAFAVLGVDVLSGRGLIQADGREQARVAVVSRTAARRFWPDRDPVGTSIRIASDPQPVRVVGVVSDFTLNWYDPELRPILYLPDAQAPARTTSVLVRTRTDPMSIARRVRAVVSSLDRGQPISGIEPLSTSIADSLSPVRVIERLLLVAAAVAAFLATAGIYGVLAQWVTRRMRELGIRLALGATRWSIAGLILREGLLMSVGGGVAGILLAGTALRATRGLLFGVPTVDGSALMLVGGGVFALAFVASWAPAYRAARVDVAHLLRLE